MKEEIQEKANYCLHCVVRPCQMSGCPLGNHIPDFIQAVKENNFEKAYEILSETTVLESICGRICPHEKQCQSKCVRGIKGEPVSIGELEAQVGDYASEHNLTIPKEAKKEGSVAIVGTGPAGLTCGAFLAKKGYMVTIWDFEPWYSRISFERSRKRADHSKNLRPWHYCENGTRTRPRLYTSRVRKRV